MSGASPRPGKKVGGRVYLHRSAVRHRPDLAPLIRKAEKLAGPWSWDVARVDPQKKVVALVKSPDFDVAPEPTVGPMLVVDLRTKKVTERNRPGLIYHHKHAFVHPSYKGFSVEASKRRSKKIGKLGADKSRIGQREYWKREVVPRLNPLGPLWHLTDDPEFQPTTTHRPPINLGWDIAEGPALYATRDPNYWYSIAGGTYGEPWGASRKWAAEIELLPTHPPVSRERSTYPQTLLDPLHVRVVRVIPTEAAIAETTGWWPSPEGGSRSVPREYRYTPGDERVYENPPQVDPALTAITRGGPSVPVKAAERKGLLEGRVLDFGCGQGEDVDWLRSRGYQATCYDPGFGDREPKGKFGTVLASYVFNTIPGEARRKRALGKAWRFVRPGGRLVATVRSPSAVKGGRRCYDGRCTTRGTFQRGFTRSQLEDFVGGLRGGEIEPGRGSMVVVRKGNPVGYPPGWVLNYLATSYCPICGDILALGTGPGGICEVCEAELLAAQEEAGTIAHGEQEMAVNPEIEPFVVQVPEWLETAEEDEIADWVIDNDSKLGAPWPVYWVSIKWVGEKLLAYAWPGEYGEEIEVDPETMWAPEGLLNPFRLTKRDHAVLEAFANGQPAESKGLWTDGQTLDGKWFGGRGIAARVGNKVKLQDLGSRSAQTVQRALKKHVPASWIENPYEWKVHRVLRGTRSPLYLHGFNELTGEPFYWHVDPRFSGKVEEGYDFSQAEYDEPELREIVARGFPGARLNPGTKGPYPFAVRQEMYGRYDIGSLWYALRDAREAAEAMRDHDPVAEAWYMDDVHTIMAELRNRGAWQPGLYRENPERVARLGFAYATRPGRRLNADPQLRELERKAAQGDFEAALALGRWLIKTKTPVIGKRETERVLERFGGARRDRIGWEYGLEQIGEQEPYVSVTHTLWRSGRDRGGGAESESTAGMLRKHFPKISPLVKWHLSSVEGVPMHYVANSLYWHDVASGRTRGAGYPDPKQAWKFFLEVSVAGVVPGEIPPPPGTPREEVEQWLLQRQEYLKPLLWYDLYGAGLLENPYTR